MGKNTNPPNPLNISLLLIFITLLSSGLSQDTAINETRIAPKDDVEGPSEIAEAQIDEAISLKKSIPLLVYLNTTKASKVSLLS